MLALQKMGVPFKAVVEESESSKYAQIVGSENLIVLPSSGQGLVYARNWIWDYAVNLGSPYFWTFDDNIRDFYRLNKNMKVRVKDGTILKIIEDFAERYVNLYISGMQYELFVPRKRKRPPFLLNTRVYSNMLIKTNIPYRNRWIYNDDTDLCLRILKDGFCTILFNAFLADKIETMSMKGGNTPIYKDDGRLKMAQSLMSQHPDVVKITYKWGKWQHQVDYRPFKNNKLIRKRGVIIPDTPNEYGMKLIKKVD
jgi:hypothetical protein